MAGLASFNLMQWIEDNRELLKPPMLNKPIWRDSDFTVIILAGPIVRNDYHINPSEEFFYQLKGNIVLKVIEDGELRDKPINEGCIMLIPPHMPHSPQRTDPESIGMVVERIRPPGVLDAFEWYCANCSSKIWRREVRVDSIAEDLPPVFEEYYGTIADGTCDKCGHPHPRNISV